MLLAVKARATLPRGRETIEGMIDNAIELWTRMAIADSERDAKVRAKVTQVQENSKKYVAEIMRIHGMKKDLYFKRHDDALGLKDHFDSLDGSLQSAQVETARLTLALKEAEGEGEELRVQRDQLQQELALARDALEGMRKSAADAASELAGLRDRGTGDSEQIAKLKRELSMEQGSSKELLKEKNELLAQVDRLNRTLTESRQEVSRCQQPSFRCEYMMNSFFFAIPVFLPAALTRESFCFCPFLQLQKALADAEVAASVNSQKLAEAKSAMSEMQTDFKSRISVLEAAAEDLQVIGQVSTVSRPVTGPFAQSYTDCPCIPQNRT